MGINNTFLVPSFRDALNDGLTMAALPLIRGVWYHVDPTSGSDNADGSDEDNALATVGAAYELCTTGAGDGIVLYSRGATSAATTSYLLSELTWSKNGITVVGIAAPTGIYGRARIANKEITTGALTVISFTNSGAADTINRSTGSFVTDGFVAGQAIRVDANSGTNSGNYTILTVAALTLTLSTGDSLTTESAATAGSTTVKSCNANNIVLSGNNNTFLNLSIWNSGTAAAALGGIKITGARNYFGNCHITGGAGCTATANERSLELGDGAQENIFRNCTIGTDTVDRGNNANCELLIAGTVANTARNAFYDCEFLAMADGGVAHVAIKSSAATSMGRHMIMRDCDFICYKSNKGADQTSVFGGTAFNTAKLGIMGACSALGYGAWDAATGNDCVYIAGGAAAAAANGISVVAS